MLLSKREQINAELQRIIEQGKPGTAMIAWKGQLSSNDVADLVAGDHVLGQVLAAELQAALLLVIERVQDVEGGDEIEGRIREREACDGRASDGPPSLPGGERKAERVQVDAAREQVRIGQIEFHNGRTTAFELTRLSERGVI